MSGNKFTSFIDLLSALSNDSEQKLAADFILKDDDYFSDIDMRVSIPRPQISQITHILKTCPNNFILSAVIKLVTMFLKENQNNDTVAIKFINSGVIAEIAEIAAPIILVPSQRYKDFGIYLLNLFVQVAGIDGKKIMESKVIESITAIIEQTTEFNADYLMLSVKCFKNISQYAALQDDVHNLVREHILQLIDNALQDNLSEYSISEELNFSIVRECLSTIHHLVVENQNHRTFYCQHNLLEYIKLASEKLIMMEDQNCLIALYADLHPIGKQELSQTILEYLPNIIEIAKKNDLELILNSCLGVIRNCTLYPNIPKEIIHEISWLMEFRSHKNMSILNNILVIFRNLCLKDAQFSSKSCIPKLVATCTSIVVNAAEFPEKVIENALAIICNLSVDDKLARYICEKGEKSLFEQLQHLTQNGGTNLVKIEAYNCIRNLLIDVPACECANELCVTVILQRLHEAKPFCRKEMVEILRNLIIQNEHCFKSIYKDPALLFEVIDSLLSSDPILLSASMDILEFFVSLQKENPTYTLDLIYNGLMETILWKLKPQNCTMPKQFIDRLITLYNQLKVFKEKKMAYADPWVQIQKGWDETDSILGRLKVEPKKQSKPKKRKSTKK
jgi:hypothetical protein